MHRLELKAAPNLELCSKYRRRAPRKALLLVQVVGNEGPAGKGQSG